MARRGRIDTTRTKLFFLSMVSPLSRDVLCRALCRVWPPFIKKRLSCQANKQANKQADKGTWLYPAGLLLSIMGGKQAWGRLLENKGRTIPDPALIN